ncbi:hypothetical protein J0J28_23045 [Vibrio vulnificus]|nr:hypothetical protein [Vibrio vulnificus]MBN8161646.1 hypothetical protein [Vibrio vulnificus]
MSGDKNLFASIQHKDQGHITFGDNKIGKIIGIGKVGKEPLPTIDNVLLVDGLMHNLLSVSQLCDMNYCLKFKSTHYLVSKKDEIAFVASRHGNTYIVKMCFFVIEN